MKIKGETYARRKFANYARSYGRFDVLHEPNKLQKGNEVITIGGLYGTIDEVDTDRKTVVLDVDGVYLTFELGAIKTVLPVSEGISATATEGASSDADSAIEE